METKSRAIVHYYAAKYANKSPNLLGTTLEERALIDQWLEVEANNFNDLVFTMVLHLVILPGMGQCGDMALVHSSENKLKKVLDVYEERLSKSKYLAGDSFSLADLSHLPAIRYLVNEAGKGHLVRERKNVNDWWMDISSRPSWKKVVKMMY
ncbi:glutathione S-transferase F11-like [Cornus florida]|uniref:glutathione S-transferase F11-like n=1 Tax=Cornus florida TaxID=4283 RepID=UPI002898EF33|nr:glutathione S-transferase F11-like [Cornus florida]